jgi:hypothetical protein
MRRNVVTIYDFAILRIAAQARSELACGRLSLAGVRRNRYLLDTGRELLVRLHGQGIQLPEIDLSYPQMAAAATSDIHSGQPAGPDQLEQHYTGKA